MQKRESTLFGKSERTEALGVGWAEDMAAASLKEPSDSCIHSFCFHSSCIHPNYVPGSVSFFSRTLGLETQLLPGGLLGTLCVVDAVRAPGRPRGRWQ